MGKTSLSDLIHWTGEAQLMGYGESDSSGAWIKLQVEHEDLTQFRGLKGTTFDLTLANPDQPTGAPAKPKGGPLSKEAGKMCNVLDFQRYAADTLSSLAGEVIEPDYHATIRFVRSSCGVESRAELDHNATAAKLFRELMSRYSKWGET